MKGNGPEMLLLFFQRDNLILVIPVYIHVIFVTYFALMQIHNNRHLMLVGKKLIICSDCFLNRSETIPSVYGLFLVWAFLMKLFVLIILNCWEKLFFTLIVLYLQLIGSILFTH